MQPEQRTTQIKVKANNIVMGQGPGATFFVTPTMARELHAKGCIDIIGDKTVKIGGSESLGKSSDAPISGPSIGSASSSETGKALQPSSSGEGPASPLSNASESSMLVQPTRVESSQSTLPTSAAPPQTSSTSRTRSGGNGTRTKTRSKRSRG